MEETQLAPKNTFSWADYIQKHQIASTVYSNNKKEFDQRDTSDSRPVNAMLLSIFPKVPTSDQNKMDRTKIKVYITPTITRTPEGTYKPGGKLEVNIRQAMNTIEDHSMIEKKFKTNAFLKEKYIINPKGETAIIWVTELDGNTLNVNDMITVHGFSISKVKKRDTDPVTQWDTDPNFNFFKEAKAIKKKKGVSAYYLIKPFEDMIPQGPIFPIFSEDWAKSNPPLNISFKVLGMSSQEALCDGALNIGDPSKGGCLVSYSPDKIPVKESWEQTKDGATRIILKINLLADQWKEGDSPEQTETVLVSLMCFDNALKATTKIRSIDNWTSIAPYMLPYMDFTVMGNIDLTRSSQMIGVNTHDNKAIAGGIHITADSVFMNMPKFVNEFGIPVTDAFARDYFEKNGKVATDLYDDDDCMMILLNEMKNNTTQFIGQNKQNMIFKAVPVLMQFGPSWRNDIAKLTPEEGTSIILRKKSHPTIQLFPNAKFLIFGIYEKPFKDFMAGKPADPRNFFNVFTTPVHNENNKMIEDKKPENKQVDNDNVFDDDIVDSDNEGQNVSKVAQPPAKQQKVSMAQKALVVQTKSQQDADSDEPLVHKKQVPTASVAPAKKPAAVTEQPQKAQKKGK
jgi:hypothetical protein